MTQSHGADPEQPESSPKYWATRARKKRGKKGQSDGFPVSPVYGDIFPSSPVHGDLRALLLPVFLFLHFSTIGQANDTPVGDVQRGWLSVAAIQPSATDHRIP